jgi:hypothetical protein
LYAEPVPLYASSMVPPLKRTLRRCAWLTLVPDSALDPETTRKTLVGPDKAEKSTSIASAPVGSASGPESRTC